LSFGSGIFILLSVQPLKIEKSGVATPIGLWLQKPAKPCAAGIAGRCAVRRDAAATPVFSPAVLQEIGYTP
jgi:hypothetical protein